MAFPSRQAIREHLLWNNLILFGLIIALYCIRYRDNLINETKDTFDNRFRDDWGSDNGTGASVILNLGGASQVGVGAEYQYDDKKEKWNYQSGGKLKLKF